MSTKVEPTPEQIEAEAEKAFTEGFKKRPDDGTSMPPAEEPAAEPPVVEAQPEPKAKDEADPYAGLPEGVREALASIPKLEHAARSAEGRYAAQVRRVDTLASELAALKIAPPAVAPAPQKSKDRETVERELPEVASLVDELESRIVDKLKTVTAAPTPPAPTQAKDERSDDEKVLDDEQPDWREKFAGTEFNAWLTTQPAEYRAKVTSTDKAATVVAALGKFDLARATRQPQGPDPITTQRQARAAAAAVPASAGRPAAARTPQLTEDEAFAAGFKKHSRSTA